MQKYKVIIRKFEPQMSWATGLNQLLNGGVAEYLIGHSGKLPKAMARRVENKSISRLRRSDLRMSALDSEGLESTTMVYSNPAR